MRRRPSCFPRPSAQRGAFAVMAVLMLLVVVASSLRFLSAASESNSSATASHQQSTRAFLAADSGIEAALARLRRSGPMACSTSQFPGGAGYSATAAQQLVNIPVAASCNGLQVGFTLANGQ